MATAVLPEKIIKDLAKLWIDLGKEDSQAGVLRACAMTLIAAVEERADAQSASETIADLVHQHPSRVIVLRIEDQTQSDFDARVFAQCWMPFGRRQQICCEQIEITASRARVDDLPNFLLGLTVPDLPVVLWCRSERLARDPGFEKLFPLASKIIVDSASFADPPAALNFIRRIAAAGHNVGDLTWTRLTRLREVVAQIFENDQARAHLKDIRSIVLTYAGPASVDPESMPTCLQYLISWFQTALSVPVETSLDAPAPEYDLRGIRMEAPGFQSAVEIQESAAEVRVNQLVRRVSFPKLSDCDLLREELNILGVDPVYRRCVG